jgi:hypothetical protein
MAMPGGWKTGKGGVKIRVTPRAARQRIGAGRNAKGDFRRQRRLARQMGIDKNVPAYNGGGNQRTNIRDPRRLPRP